MKQNHTVLPLGLDLRALWSGEQRRRPHRQIARKIDSKTVACLEPPPTAHENGICLPLIRRLHMVLCEHRRRRRETREI